ncbi:hypothetical protein AcV5_008828 [Taiwanofungus camphoratus]|nr:hypothetical protein AcV5_008828 [Antrodia cinnamomea]
MNAVCNLLFPFWCRTPQVMRILLACEELRLSTFVVSPARTVRQGRDDRRLKTTGSRGVPVPNYRCDLLSEARCLICTADVAFQWVFHWKRTARRRSPFVGSFSYTSTLSREISSHYRGVHTFHIPQLRIVVLIDSRFPNHIL